jgi:carboxyl-terminal processing protease
MTDAGYLLFENVYPRLGGEKEFYLVTKSDDTVLTAAIAKAINDMPDMQLGDKKAVAAGGNLVYIPIPPMLQRTSGDFIQKVSALTFQPPEKSEKEAPVATGALIMLLNQVDDQNVQMSALLALARKDSVEALKAIEDTYGRKAGWAKRCASFAITLYGKENETTLKEYRTAFDQAYAVVQQLLTNYPGDKQQINKYVADLQAAFEKMVAYAPPAVAGVDAVDEKLRKGLMEMHELIGRVADYYAHDEDVNVDKLFGAAMKGISDYIDKYSEVFDRATKERWDQNVGSKFVGIGVTIEKDDEGNFIIMSPIFGSPAYKAGFKPRDVIVTVDGKEVKGLQLEDLRGMITGEAGTTVRIGIMRSGWKEPAEFPIVRAVITLPVALFKMMPGNVGYLRLLQFSTDSTQEFAKALAELTKENLKGLVIDLRNNPGGGLQQTLEICDMFIQPGKKLASMKGRPGSPWNGPEWSATLQARKQPNYPVTILVNGASASGAELFTGAMKDNGRATIIGQKTFGKGCGQVIFPLYSSNGELFLKLTVFKYYLPGGQCIDGSGIEPDIALAVEEAPEWKTEEYKKLTEKVFQAYTDKYYKDNEELFKRLADGDGSNAKSYPGFDEFYKSLNTKLDEQDVRRELRAYIRNLISREAGKASYVNDIQEDKELQRALYEVMKKLGVDPKSVPGFEDYAKRIEKALAEEKKPE